MKHGEEISLGGKELYMMKTHSQSAANFYYGLYVYVRFCYLS